MTDINKLQAKESSLFRSALRFYELKQYKKGLKTAEQILKKNPEHGETLALKGLFLCNLGRKEEGYAEVKRGIKNNIRSYICWHVFGLIHRLDKNYEEAIKCYTMALRIDKDNIQIVRDLANLQIQMRNYEGLNETEYQLVNLRPNNKQFWIGLAFSYFLLKRYDSALKVLEAFESSLKEKPTESKYEVSEMLLFKNLITEESGDLEGALKHLEEFEDKIVDKKSLLEARARILVNLNRKDEAEKIYKQLFDRNSNCDSYLQNIFKCNNINLESPSDDDVKKIIEINSELLEKYPKSLILKRTPLIYLKGEEFNKEIKEYLKIYFIKCVPSLFNSLKDIYVNPEKAKVIESTALEYYDQLEKNGKFDGDEQKQYPTTKLWILIFLSKLYDNKRNSTKALEYINKAIEHTPTLVESYMLKARIYKHAGDLETAMNIMNEARELDLQDRFVNSKCVKYMLRNGNIDEAEKTAGLFTKVDSPSPLADLTEMQCTWYEFEKAMAYKNKGDNGLALKLLHQINKHFNDIYDDQFDFHVYCLRKSSFRAYIDLLQYEDKIKSHPYFFRAAVALVKLYLKLNSQPRKTKEELEMEKYANLSPSERKKALRKARKAQLKNAQTQVEQTQKKEDNTTNKKTDDDPNGEKLLNAKDYVEECVPFIKSLLEFAPNKIESHILASQVYILKKKYLLALKSLKKSLAIDKNNGEVHKNIVQFVKNCK
ncbi:putative N-terminal acetyltransferase [Piromyces finnis]|uniref:Putative N-terminal acetyltransferase n=1 Tax=Piromyces finnis TaxID=1754191 RepID=A0A1Y1VJN1_9FUNG|nr:putative N-terminal acetyltransferase [Piromyces finnis]|eukprot:ORX57911.1 putative N-terminal acetyltransferase [Piromyces finnis]